MSISPAPLKPLDVAYVVSKYPAVSHTFILREVRGLRTRGVRVETVSVRRPLATDLPSQLERDEAQRTHALLPVAFRRLLRVHLRAMSRSPTGYLRTLVDALALSRGGLRSLLWQVFYFVEALLLWAFLAETGVRHVHVHFANVGSDLALLATSFANRSRKSTDPKYSWTWTLHGPTELYDVYRYKLAVKVARADGVTCISHYARSQLMRLVARADWRKLHLVRLGVDTAWFSPSAPRPTNEELTILSVARLAPDKGHLVLLEALGVLAERGYRFRCILVGDGPERESLTERIDELELADRVELTGALNQDEVHRHLESADVFCLSSFAEGLPTVLMEAMAMALPVVATRVMGVPELVTDEESGLLVPPGAAEPLAVALERLLGEDRLRTRLAAAGRARVAAEFELSRSIDQMERFLRTASDNS